MPKYRVMRCIDAFRDQRGQPGEHKVPVSEPMNRTTALATLAEIERKHLTRDFSIRRIATVLQLS